MGRTPADYSMDVVRGATWDDTFDYVDDQRQPIDLTDYQARMQIRTREGQFGTTGAETLVLELSTANGMLKIDAPEDGQVVLRVEAEDTVQLNPDNEKRVKLVYSLELFIPAGGAPEFVIPLVKGAITVQGQTTR